MAGLRSVPRQDSSEASVYTRLSCQSQDHNKYTSYNPEAKVYPLQDLHHEHSAMWALQ